MSVTRHFSGLRVGKHDSQLSVVSYKLLIITTQANQRVSLRRSVTVHSCRYSATNLSVAACMIHVMWVSLSGVLYEELLFINMTGCLLIWSMMACLTDSHDTSWLVHSSSGKQEDTTWPYRYKSIAPVFDEIFQVLQLFLIVVKFIDCRYFQVVTPGLMTISMGTSVVVITHIYCVWDLCLALQTAREYVTHPLEPPYRQPWRITACLQ